MIDKLKLIWIANTYRQVFGNMYGI